MYSFRFDVANVAQKQLHIIAYVCLQAIIVHFYKHYALRFFAVEP